MLALIGWLAVMLCGQAAPPSAADLVSLRWVGPLALSPAGTTLLFASGAWSLDSEHWVFDQQLYVLPTAGGSPRALTVGPGDPDHAVWSPDGSAIAFLRDMNDAPALWVLPMNAGEARRVELHGLVPAKVAFMGTQGALWLLASPSSAADGAPFRFGHREPHRQVYLIDPARGPPLAITDGADHVVDFVASPDGDRLALKTSASADPYPSTIEPSLHVWTARGVHPVATETCVESMAFSPDGQRLAWVGCATGFLTDALMVHDLESATTENLLRAEDLTVYDAVWEPSGRRLLAEVGVGTRTQLWVVDRRGRAPRHLSVDDPVFSGLAIDRRGTTLYTRTESPTHPTRIAAVDVERGRTRVLWDPNPQAASWTLVEPQTISWRGAEGNDLEGLLWPPEGEARALMVKPHGGPDSVSTEHFARWPQYFATHGYAVFEPNYRGGLAYGRAAYAANRGRLGEIEFLDIESGVDHLIVTGHAQPDRLVYGGWSWGGYLTAWTLGHTDRYRAAVAGAPVVDTVAQYVGSDINHARVGDWEYRARPWGEGFAAFDRANPRQHLHAARTPTLILHGTDDTRVPFDQGVTLYRALSDHGVQTEFWAYPGEDHYLEQPMNRVHRMEVWRAWYDRHLPP